MSGKKRNFCNEFYTLCHIRFQVLAIIGDKSILMFVEISMRFQFLQFVMSLKKHHSHSRLLSQEPRWSVFPHCLVMDFTQNVILFSKE